MPAETRRSASTHDSYRGLEVVTLRRLWLGLERTKQALARSMIAYRESRELLRRIDEPGNIGFKKTDGHDNVNLEQYAAKADIL